MLPHRAPDDQEYKLQNNNLIVAMIHKQNKQYTIKYPTLPNDASRFSQSRTSVTDTFDGLF